MAYTLKQKGQQVQDMLDAVEKKTGYAGTTPFLKEATGSDSGLMSAADKEKLDSIGIISNEEIERVWNLL